MNQAITITLLDEKEIPALAYMIPKKIIEMMQEEELICLAAKGPDAITMAVVVFREYAHNMELLWIYTEPEFRRMKLATKLLERMEASVHESEYFIGICADYEREEENALDALLDKSGFDRQLQEWPLYRFHLSDAYALEEFHRKNQKELRIKGLCKISECTDAMKKRFSHTMSYSEELPFIESPIEWKRYDEKLSCIYVEKGEIEGVLLIETSQDRIHIAFAYAKDNPYVFPYMVGKSFYEAMDKYQGQNPQILVTVFGDSTEKLLLKLVPNASSVTMTHAQKVTYKKI